MNENKKTIKLSETELKDIIKESVSSILNEIGDTRRGRYKMGRVMGRQMKRGQQDHDAITSNMGSSAFRFGLYDEKPYFDDESYLEQFGDYFNKWADREKERKRKERMSRVSESKINNIVKEATNILIKHLMN